MRFINDDIPVALAKATLDTVDNVDQGGHVAVHTVDPLDSYEDVSLAGPKEGALGTL
jgi:hypothetical protein